MNQTLIESGRNSQQSQPEPIAVDASPATSLSPQCHDSFSWYTVSSEVKELLVLAAAHWQEERSQYYIDQALAVAGDNPDVLISAYRYCFYKQNYALALQVVIRVMQQVRQAEHLPEAWDDLKPIVLARKEEPAIRLFLNACAASGLVLARLGELARAREISAQIAEIDDRKEFGGAVILDILTQPANEEEE